VDESSTFNKSGKCIIVSAPSGAGKTTIVHYLLRELDQLAFSVSACSREPRGRELPGIDYHYFSVDEFKHKIRNNEFVEWQEVYPNNFYGTLKSEIQKSWDTGKIVVFDVDAEGGINLKKIFGANSISIFIKPPSLFVLEQRLRNRRTETDESIKMRIEKANREMERAEHFDWILLNDNLEKACLEIKEKVKSFIA